MIERQHAFLACANRQGDVVVTSLYARRGKRLFDLIAAAFGLVIASPILLFCSVAICLLQGRPILFRQIRIGQYGRPFWILKFRTMVVNSSGPQVTTAGDPRITRLGRFLRNTKFDELPQLINVLRGEMSFVGPRPEVPEYVARYTPVQKQVLQAKPGITGPASVAFAREEDLLKRFSDRKDFYVTTLLPQKLHLDLAYCRNIQFSRDLELIVSTISSLAIRRDGCSLLSSEL